jgi:hypothetical protein
MYHIIVETIPALRSVEIAETKSREIDIGIVHTIMILQF